MGKYSKGNRKKVNKLVTRYWLSRQYPSDSDLESELETEYEYFEHFDQEGSNQGQKWHTLEHNGVLFPPPYIPHGIPVLYDGVPVTLEPTAEEYATLYARYTDHEYLESKIFKKNFWSDWSKTLKDTPIKNLDQCDFKLIYEHIVKLREKKKQITPEEKEILKKQREEEEAPYKVAKVDGKEQPVGNFRLEPPNIFTGRGCHPKLGSIKPRIEPRDITINIGTGVPVPKPPYGSWGAVVHNNDVMWLASWHDAISGGIKYVWLGTQSDWKAESDKNKFDFARKLKKNIKHIRENNNENMQNPELKIRQIATALYFIDNFALRVGNEKGDDEADTVGVTSLRVEHINLLENFNIKLDFLGKDSIRYVKKVQVNEIVYKNLQEFTNNKSKDQDLFDKIRSNDLNNYLDDFLPGLTAKVFRTYNASHLLQKELNKVTKKYSDLGTDDKTNKLYDGYNKANAAVALLCNHQKKVTKSFNEQIKKLDLMISKYKREIKKIQESRFKKKGTKKQRKKQLEIEKLGLDQTYSNTDTTTISDTETPEPLTATKKEKIKKLQRKIIELKAKKSIKIDLKGVSLDTSKTNYIDPRITVAFAKKHNLSLDKLYSKKLQDKFFWAMDVTADFKF